jgi:DNA-binding Xre family transcriptional regulator
VDIEEYRKNAIKKTCNTKEFAEIIGVSYSKALSLTRIEGFPLLKIGRVRRVVLSKLDEFLEAHIGEIL